MSPALRNPEKDHDSHRKFEMYAGSVFTPINPRPPRPFPPSSPSGTVESERAKAWKSVRREPTLGLPSNYIDRTQARKDKSDEDPFKRKRPHLSETGTLGRFSETSPVLARPSVTKPTLEPYQGSLATKRDSDAEHHANAGFQDRGRDQRRDPGTLELPYTNTSFMSKGNPSERNRIDTDGLRVDQHYNQIQARKREEPLSVTETCCGTCRKRKKMSNEANPECEDCLRGSSVRLGSVKQPPLSKNDSAQISPALHPQQHMSSADVPARLSGRFSVHPVRHILPREPSQIVLMEPPVTSGITTYRDRPVSIDQHGHHISTPSPWFVTSQNHAHKTLAPPQSDSPTKDSHTQQNVRARIRSPPIVATQPMQHSRLNPLTPTNDNRSDSNHYASSLLPPTIAVASNKPPHSLISHCMQPSPHPKSEKNKMLSGEPFLPSDEQLAKERALAIPALSRYNTAVHISPRERAWLFGRIVRGDWNFPEGDDCHVTGHVGHSVYVNAPFNCEYGYNLSIGDNVVVGADCIFHDSGRISIGSNTTIRPCVTITTLKEPTHRGPSRKPSERTETARNVFIGENVYIGDRCIISAGVRIGDNAIVPSGSLIVRDIPATRNVPANAAQDRQVQWKG